MPPKADLTGQRFGRLIVICEGTRKIKNRITWLCECDCGNYTTAMPQPLKDGRTQSCGCYNRDQTTKLNTTHGETKKNSNEYSAWSGIKTRCYNDNLPQYKDYGGRGITVCDRWLDSYEYFLSDMGRKPSSCHSIERKDNNKGYSPDNCRWATRKEQQNNMRTNRVLALCGVSMTVAEWAVIMGGKAGALYTRLSAGWSIERTLGTPIRGTV